MPRSTWTETDAFIEGCKVHTNSLTALYSYNNSAHAMFKSELIIEKRSSPEIISHSARKTEGQLANAGAINIYLKTHKCFNDLLQSLPDKSRLIACEGRWCLTESVGGFHYSQQENQYSVTFHHCSLHIWTYGSVFSSVSMGYSKLLNSIFKS